ncbi:hypothetical protein ES702_02840 [subsurface metagenome]
MGRLNEHDPIYPLENEEIKTRKKLKTLKDRRRKRYKKKQRKKRVKNRSLKIKKDLHIR